MNSASRWASFTARWVSASTTPTSTSGSRIPMLSIPVVPGILGSSAEFVGKTVFHRRLRRPRCSPSLKASLASSAAAPALTLGCAPRCRLVWRWGTGPPAGAPGTGCRRPTEVGTGIFAVEQKNKVLCFNYLCAHRPLDCPQILRRRRILFRIFGVNKRRPA